MVVMEAGIMVGSVVMFGYVYLTFLKKMVRESEDNMERDEARRQRRKARQAKKAAEEDGSKAKSE